MTKTKIEHALDAARRNLPVFPQTGKVPMIRAWPTNATLKPSVIGRWWARWPDADIGIALPSDIYVFDLDSPAASTKFGELIREHVLPDTLTVSTLRGLHIYFRVPHELRRMPGGGQGLDAIEGKGSPGPVTWAGSTHTGGWAYRIRGDHEIATMPDSLVQLIGPKPASRNSDEASDAERARWKAAHLHMLSMDVMQDARADLRLAKRALRLELPDMPAGWADRFYRAGAYLGGHVAVGGLDYEGAVDALEGVFYELDAEGGDPEHVLRSIRRGLAAGARELDYDV